MAITLYAASVLIGVGAAGEPSSTPLSHLADNFTAGLAQIG